MPRVLVLKSEEVHRLVDLKALVEDVEKAFAELAEGRAVMPERLVMTVEGNWWGLMTARLSWTGVAVKAVSVIERNRERGLPVTQAVVLYLDAETGTPLAVIDGTSLTAFRTGAATAVSVKHMAPRPVESMAIVGAGFQAWYQVLAVKAVAPELREVRIYDVIPEASRRLAERVGRELGLEAKVCGSAAEAVRDVQVVVTATTSREPVLKVEWLRAPVHVASIGVTGPGGRELGDDVMAAAEVVAVDHLEACLREVGDVRLALESGALAREKVVELGEIVLGRRKGRLGRGITVFKSVGLGIQDAAAAEHVYRRALEGGAGVPVEL